LNALVLFSISLLTFASSALVSAVNLSRVSVLE
jgi:hypothetical protein